MRITYIYCIMYMIIYMIFTQNYIQNSTYLNYYYFSDNTADVQYY